MNTESYEEYVQECKDAGLEPLSQEAWLEAVTAPDQQEIAQEENVPSITDLIAPLVDDLEVVDYDVIWPGSLDDDNSVEIKIVHVVDGDEVEKFIYLKLVIDEEKMAEQEGEAK